MFKIKAPDGSNNLCGNKLRRIREKQDLSQRRLAQKLQVMGYDVDHHFIRRVELGERFVTDIEIVMLANALQVDVRELLF
ncbi:MAG: helix-turn-helix domain-containing protein [Christensenellales bacterium]